jgi:hypothetical protein
MVEVDTIRDIVVVVAGIIWSIVFVAILAVVLVVLALLRRYAALAHRFLSETARGYVDAVRQQAEVLAARTARLPGRPALASVQRPGADLRMPEFRLPFFRRRRPWWRRLIER